jgi:acetyl esterase/lipase
MKNGLMAITGSVIVLICINSCSKSASSPEPGITYNPSPPTENVVYGTAKDWQGNLVSLDMNIYQPSNMPSGSKHPLIVFMHGGGFLTGDKKDAITKCKMLADSGFVAATINYRLGWNKADTEDCMADTSALNIAIYRGVQDANAALRYLVAHAEDYSIDTDWVFLCGSSAGAVLSLICSYETDACVSQRYPQAAAELGSLFNADNNLTNTFKIEGICSMWGAASDSNLINSATAIPTIFFYGTDDKVVPPDFGPYLHCENYPMLYGSLCLYRRLIANNTAAVLHIMPREGHGFPEDGKYTDEFFMGNTACFFHSVMQKTSPHTGVYVGPENNCQ